METKVETCENCGRAIGKLETPHIHDGHVVCVDCVKRLKADEPVPVACDVVVMSASADAEEYRALGLSSRGVAWTVALLGLCLLPWVIGIPLFVWGAIADWMLVKHRRRHALIER